MKKLTSAERIDELIEMAFKDNKILVILFEEILENSRVEWLTSELEKMDESRLAILHEKLKYYWRG